MPSNTPLSAASCAADNHGEVGVAGSKGGTLACASGAGGNAHVLWLVIYGVWRPNILGEGYRWPEGVNEVEGW